MTLVKEGTEVCFAQLQRLWQRLLRLPMGKLAEVKRSGAVLEDATWGTTRNTHCLKSPRSGCQLRTSRFEKAP